MDMIDRQLLDLIQGPYPLVKHSYLDPAGHRAVAHCYEKRTFLDWPYSHFTMVHATSQERCEQYSREIAEATGTTERLALYSTHEYKKTRVRYFVPDHDDWFNAGATEIDAEFAEAN